MPEIYLTPASISYLTQLILVLIITTYLIGRAARNHEQLSPQDGYLLAIFASLTLLSLLFFLEFALLPFQRSIAFNLQNTAVAILMATLIQFAYHFPALQARQKLERRAVFFISGLYILWEMGWALHLETLLLAYGHVTYRPNYLQYVMILEFAWAVFVFARNTIRHWELPAIRNFAIILLIPLAVAVLTNYQNADKTITFLFPILSSTGLPLTIFLFAINYLSSQPDRVSFVVKISGIVLTSVLAVFGAISWLITAPYADKYISPIMALEGHTLHFHPEDNGGYMAEEIPFHWEDDMGERAPYPAINQVTGYDFDFPFFGQPYQQIFVSGIGGIGLGKMFYETDFQANFTSIPTLFPLLVCKGPSNDPAHGEYVRIEPGKAVITWHQLTSCAYSPVSEIATYTYQAVLYRDGSFHFSYKGLPDLKFHTDTQPDTTAWAIGIKTAQPSPGTTDFSNLPLRIGPQGAIHDEYRSFRLYIHQFLLPVAVAVLASSLAVLLVAALVLNYGLARPLNALLEGVQNFEKGGRGTTIPVQSNDEIGYLTQAFNRVGGELNDLIENLEQQVAERTCELVTANEQLRTEMNARLATQEQVLAQQRVVAMLEEREHLARDLHDGIGQVLGFLNVQAQGANDAVLDGEKELASHLLARMAEVAQEAHDDVRGYILGLKQNTPPNFFSLLEQYCQHLQQNFGFRVSLNLPDELPSRLADYAIETQLLYIIREALSNAHTHSGQQEASVIIGFDEQRVQAVIVDHGRGFGQQGKSGHFGLGMMCERAQAAGGDLQIESSPGAGTRITLSLPRQPGATSIAGRRILLVDDHPLFLEGMTNLVTGRGMTVVATASDGLEAHEKALRLRPDVILMDIEMPNCDGLEATRRIKADMPDAKIVMLTVSGEEHHLFESLQNGASGYLLKNLSAAELTTLLVELLRGEISLSPGLAHKMLDAFSRRQSLPAQPPGLRTQKEPQPDVLSARQVEILRLVAQGETYKEIAIQLGLAEVTIKYHMGEILARLHLHSRRDAVDYYQHHSQ